MTHRRDDVECHAEEYQAYSCIRPGRILSSVQDHTEHQNRNDFGAFAERLRREVDMPQRLVLAQGGQKVEYRHTRIGVQRLARDQAVAQVL